MDRRRSRRPAARTGIPASRELGFVSRDISWGRRPMRRRPMQVWPRGQLNTGGSRALLALVVFALLAMLVPSSAAAATPTISYSIDGIAGTNGWWRGSTHGNYVVLHWTVTANPPLTNTVGCDPAISIPGPTPLQGVTKTCTAPRNDDGNASLSKTIKVDADPPVIVQGGGDEQGGLRPGSLDIHEPEPIDRRSSNAGRAAAPTSRSSSAARGLSTPTRRSRPGSSTSTRSRPPIRQATPRRGSPSRACRRC